MSEKPLIYEIGGARWRVDRGAELLRDYKLKAEDLAKWHGLLEPMDHAFEMVCRFYGVFDVVATTDVEKMQPWTVERIAAASKREASEVRDYLNRTKAYWDREQKKQAGSTPKTSQNQRPDPDQAEQERLLELYGFITQDEKERRVIAVRCIELAKFLENDSLRSTAESLIRQERNMASLDELIATERGPESKIKLLNARNAIQEKVEKTMERLGIFDAPEQMRKRRGFQDSLGTVISGVLDYRANGDRTTIDGMFTEFELEVLLRDFDIRAAQYDPLLATLVVPPAIEHLFNPDYVPAKMSLRVRQLLRKGFKSGLAAARGEAGHEPEDLDRLPEEDDEAEIV